MHCIGVNKIDFNQKNVISFAQEAFGIEQATHDAIYRSVKEKDVTIIEKLLLSYNYLLFNVYVKGS